MRSESWHGARVMNEQHHTPGAPAHPPNEIRKPAAAIPAAEQLQDESANDPQDAADRAGALPSSWKALKAGTGYWLWSGDLDSDTDPGMGVARISFSIDFTTDETAGLVRLLEKAPEMLELLRESGECRCFDIGGPSCPTCIATEALIDYIDGKDAP